MKAKPFAAQPVTDSPAAPFPGLFVERLIEPMFANPQRAALAVNFLGAPLAHVCARLCREPAVDGEALQRDAAFDTIVARRTRTRAVELATTLDRDGVHGVAMKGLAVALNVYGNPAWRLLPDVDFLYREADLPRLAQSLSSRGYRTSVGAQEVRAWGVLAEASFAPIYPPDGSFFLDVHQAVDERPASLGLPTALVFDRAERVETEWGPCRVTAREHSFAIIALNLYRDFYRPEALKGVFDGCLILNRFGDRLDWAHVEAVARRGRFVNRLVFCRDLLEALGAGRAPVFESRTLARWLRPTLAGVAENYRSLDWLVMSDGRKMMLETGLLDSPLATLRLHWRRLRGLAAPPMHFLPGVPAFENEDSDDHDQEA